MPQFCYDLGYPTKFGSTHLGLYQPVLGCFLLTLCDAQQAREIMLLASARYSLYLVDLTCAKNYQPNVIDNDCCQNWTISNKEDISIGMSDQGNNIIGAKELMLCSNQDLDIKQEKKYLQLTYFYVKYLFEVEQRSRGSFVKNQWINDIIGTNMPNKKEQSVLSIKKLLYLETDTDLLETKIQQIINSSELRHYNDFIS